MKYLDRQDAGKRLAESLQRYADKDTVVLALPRGGIVLGAEVAQRLRAPLGLVLVRKIGHPLYEEYAIGAVVEGEAPLYDEHEIDAVDQTWLQEAEAAAQRLLHKRHELYYGDDFEVPSIEDKTVIIVDDGVATGLTMQASVRAVRHARAKCIVVAVPAASRESVDELGQTADEVVVLDDPSNFLGAVGAHYMVFDQVDDEEVKSLLREANRNVYAATTSNA